MGFLQPLALLALPAAGIPLLLHLWRRRTPPRVPFPAIRYIARTTEEHRRRLRLQHLLLLILRTLVVLAVVLAAARPVVRARWAGASTHEPMALAVVFDNSLSSGAIREGTPTIELLKRTVRGTLDALTADDRLWLVLADGVPRSTAPNAAAAIVDSVGAWGLRLELGIAVTQAVRAVNDAGLPRREVHLVSDLQRSALETEAVTGTARIVAVAPGGNPPPNVGVGVVAPRDALVGATGGTVVATPAGTPDRETTLTLSIGDRPVARAAVRVNESAELAVPMPGEGWWVARLTASPDEVLADNEAEVALRFAPPAQVALGPTVGDFVEQAVAVLRDAGRLVEGNDTHIAELPLQGPTLLLPPADPSRIGAVNRALASRGVAWRYEPGGTAGLVGASPVPGVEGAAVRRRYRLVASAVPRGVLAAVDGDPWLVRAGDNLVLLGSRLDESWSDLPLRPGFVPALDHLLNRTLRGELADLEAAPGSSVRLPDRVTAIARGGSRRPVEPGSMLAAPLEPGAYFLLAGADTVGTLSVQVDPRESVLTQATRSELADVLGHGADIVEADRYARGPFAVSTRTEAAGSLLIIALIAVLCETMIAWRLRGTAA